MVLTVNMQHFSQNVECDANTIKKELVKICVFVVYLDVVNYNSGKELGNKGRAGS